MLEYKKQPYLVVVDYFSRYVELEKLTTTTSQDIIRPEVLFARHGIPEIVMWDSGPQYASKAFDDFASVYGFTHVTSSPRYAQANGMVEQAVQSSYWRNHKIPTWHCLATGQLHWNMATVLPNY